ncbi:MAG TPA: hypothetical protein VHW47_01190, partial [Acidimicrobiales bacterium]|nr:hypothetical protein [Acidimicrobiales bacterium]
MTLAPLSSSPLVDLPLGPVRTPWERLSARIDLRRVGVVLGTYVAVIAVFGIILVLRGADPFSVFNTMLHSTLLNWPALQQTMLRAVPLAMAALAVAIPARAGLVNVGG